MDGMKLCENGRHVWDSPITEYEGEGLMFCQCGQYSMICAKAGLGWIRQPKTILYENL